MAKLLTVFGATGQQGGALIEHILKRPNLSNLFRIRGVTRDATKPAATKLSDLGVEMVQANLNDPISVRSVVAGSDAVFAITNFWDEGSAAVEISQGKTVADACVTTGVAQIIWSSLPHVAKMTSSELTAVHHFDSKAEVEEYIRTLNIKSAFFLAGWFMQNHLGMFRPQPAGDGTYFISSSLWTVESDSHVPAIDIRDIGKFIAPALLNPNLYHGARFTSATAFYTPAEMVETWTKVTGKKVDFKEIGTAADFDTISEEQKEAFQSGRALLTKWAYFGPTGKKDLEWTLEQMTEKPTTWEEFVKEHEPWFVD